MIESKSAYDKRSVHDPYELESAVDLANSDPKVRYIVDDVVPFAQWGVIAAVEKCLKTTIGLDLAVSVASGRPFLNHFSVFDSGPVGFWCGESGRPTIKETLDRICAAKGLELSAIGHDLRLGYSTPSLKRELDVIQRFVEREKPKLLLLDPLTFGLRDIAGDMSNATAVNSVLSPLNQICHENGCSFIAIAHNKKPTNPEYGTQFKVPKLEDIAGAGIGAWARYWMLLGKRREFVEETGDHRLWMKIGGSAGHAGRFGLDVHEGNRQDPGGRAWNVELRSVEEAKLLDRKVVQKRDDSSQNSLLERRTAKVIAFLQTKPSGETKQALINATGINSKLITPIVEDLLEAQRITPVRVLKGGKHQPGFMLSCEALAA